MMDSQEFREFPEPERDLTLDLVRGEESNRLTRSSSAVGLALEAMAMGSISCLKGVGSRSAMSSSLQMK